MNHYINITKINKGAKDYYFVYLNGCRTADATAGSATNGFITAFDTKIYIGNGQNGTKTNASMAAGFAEEFVTQCKNHVTVQAAINAVIANYPGNTTNVAPVQGGAETIDITP